MRLGDLDALKTKIEINFSRKPEAQAIYKHLIDIIEDAPTIADKFEVVLKPRGKWDRNDIWVNGEYVGGFYHVDCPAIEDEDNDAVYSKWTSDFCPNCGARMSRTFGGES